MRTYQTISGIILAAATFSVGALYAQASPPSAKPAVASTCDAQGQGCTKARAEKMMRKSADRGTAGQYSRFNADTCNRLQNRVERDTCLNHAEAWV